MSTLPRVSVYLDIDGVINAMSGRPPRHDTGWTGEWSTERIDEIAVSWSHELVDALNELAALPNVRPVWLTSWESSAATHLSPAISLDGAGWPVLTGLADDASFEWWKLGALRADLAEHTPDRFVWADDDIAYDQQAPAWLGAQTEIPQLAIIPKGRLGLTRSHLERIRAFVAS